MALIEVLTKTAADLLYVTAGQIAGLLPATQKGAANGLATLDGSSVLTRTQAGTMLCYRGLWAANTAYKANDLMHYRGQLWVRIADGTSGTVFDVTAWTLLGEVAADAGNRLWTGQETFSSSQITTAHALTSGQISGTCFQARKSETVAHIRVNVGVASSGTPPTICRAALLEESADGLFYTFVGLSANDVTMYNATGPKTIDLTAGVDVVRGKRYAWAPFVVTAGGLPSLGGRTVLNSQGSLETALLPRAGFSQNSQPDLPAIGTVYTPTAGGSATTKLMFAALTP